MTVTITCPIRYALYFNFCQLPTKKYKPCQTLPNLHGKPLVTNRKVHPELINATASAVIGFKNAFMREQG